MHGQGIDGISGTAGFAVFQTEEASNHGVLFFDQSGVFVPEEHRHKVPIVLRVITPARQDLDHILFAIESLPGVFVGFGPFLGRHARMMDGGVKRIAFVEIGIHPLAALPHFAMVLRTGQWGQHEKRGLVGPDFVHQKTNVVRHLIFAVPRKTDDVSRVHHHSGLVPFFDDISILLDVVLLLTFGLQVLRVNAFHADEDLSTPRLSRQADKILWLAGQIHLHHKRDLNAFLPEFDDGFESLAPEFLPGKIVIGEEIKRYAMLRIVPTQERRDALRTALAHLASLHIDDRAEAASKRTAPRSIRGSESRIGKMLHSLGAGLRQRRRFNID